MNLSIAIKSQITRVCISDVTISNYSHITRVCIGDAIISNSNALANATRRLIG